MSAEPAFTDEELTAWLDGEADAALSARIAAAGPALDARLEALCFDAAALRAGFDVLLTAAPAAPAMAPPKPAAWRRPAMAAAIALVCLATGAMLGDVVREDPLDDWRGYAAAYHRLYVEDTLSGPVDVASAEAALERVTTQLGAPITPDALAVDGLTFRRAQMLGFEGAPLVQIAFTTADGAPVALCVIARPGATPQPISGTRIMDMAAARWANDGYEFLLIGGDDGRLIAAAADAFAAAL